MTARPLPKAPPEVRQRALSIYEKNPEISVGAKVEFPIGKKLFHLVVNPGTSGCPTILFSEYEPLNKHCYYSLLDTYQLIQGQGSRGTKCLHCRLAKKQTVH